MARTNARPVTDARLGELLRQQSDLDGELKRVQRQIDQVETRSARSILEGLTPGPTPELPKLIERRAELFRQLRLTRLALDMARGRA